jgi:hypothetical protein
MINSIINLYQKKNDESTSVLINLIKNNKDKDKDKENDKQINKNNNLNKKEFILKDLIEISNKNIFDENDENENELENLELNNNDNQNLKNYNVFYKKKNEPNSIDYLINKNVELIFNNCINLILSQEEKIENLLKSVKELNTLGFKKSMKFKKKATENFGSTATSEFLQSKESSLEENIKKMFQNEKNKYKYRISFLRSFVSKFIVIIIQTSIKIFQNIDGWIIKSVTLQSEAQNKVIQKLRSILNEKRLINVESDIHTIELDTFKPVINKNNENNSQIPRDNNSNIYQKKMKKKKKKKKKFHLKLNIKIISEIFTLLYLIGCRILTDDKEKEMLNTLKYKIINKRYLSQKDFYKYYF